MSARTTSWRRRRPSQAPVPHARPDEAVTCGTAATAGDQSAWVPPDTCRWHDPAGTGAGQAVGPKGSLAPLPRCLRLAPAASGRCFLLDPLGLPPPLTASPPQGAPVVGTTRCGRRGDWDWAHHTSLAGYCVKWLYSIPTRDL